jgi:hypothetical protein
MLGYRDYSTMSFEQEIQLIYVIYFMYVLITGYLLDYC